MTDPTEMVNRSTKSYKWNGTLELTRVDNVTIDSNVADAVLQPAGGDE